MCKTTICSKKKNWRSLLEEKYKFESERLRFRYWEDSDIVPFAKMNTDEEVMQYFPRLLTYVESEDLVNKIKIHFEKWGFGLWAVEEKSSEKFIGFIGLNYVDFKSSFTPCVEIGWRLGLEFWNKGYASEGAKICLQSGFSEFGLTSIYSFTSILNSNSEKVMMKIGMKKILEFDHPNLEKSNPLCKHVLYHISQGERRHNT
ncbi:MAG: GNAT family N-acetyltransferase [Leptospiraceae bacterium]|nr:GNAT family N-acetyltransferase [Leptospiraceae bacterium]